MTFLSTGLVFSLAADPAEPPEELILVITEQNRDGRRFEQHLVLEKQAPKNQ
ncbi:MAG: hypothetical protein ABIZ80_25930 [Bryobacteraceae bacterium]